MILIGKPVPPAPTTPAFLDRTSLPGAHPDGSMLLTELPEAYRLQVWRVLRLVLLHARATRADGFEPPAHLPRYEEEILRSTIEQPLRAPLAVILRQLAGPGIPDVSAIAWSCWCVVDWAVQRFDETALAFSEAAALVWPLNARYAMLHARMLRGRARTPEAETWYRRAIVLARRQGDPEVQSLARCGLAMHVWERGRGDLAETLLRKAQSVARRAGLRTLEREILHDRFAVATTRSQFREAEAFARGAFEGYLPDHPRLPALVYDLAYFWLSQGYADHALRMLIPLLPCFTEPAARLQVLAATARAAAMADREDCFSAAAEEAERLAAECADHQVLAATLIDIGLGAASAGDRALAHRLFHEAISAAMKRQQEDMVKLAREGLDRVERGDREVAITGPRDPQRRAFSDRAMRALQARARSVRDGVYAND